MGTSQALSAANWSAPRLALAGGINRFYHFRAPTPVDNQPTVRMNRDTLYSTAVVDISEGATLTLPDVGARYMTAMIYNQDHFVNEVFHGGGTYTLDMDDFDTRYVIGRVNCIPITPGWSYAVRLYQPRAEILDGSWTFPAVDAVN